MDHRFMRKSIVVHVHKQPQLDVAIEVIHFFLSKYYHWTARFHLRSSEEKPMSPWIPVIATLIGGGAMGALIAGYLLHRRNKRQPVVYSKEIIHIFRKNKDFKELEARLLVKDTTLADAPEQSVDYLSLVRITLTNKGDTDI